MTVVLLILAALSFLYFLFLLLAASVSSAFVWFWSALSACCLALIWFRGHYQSLLWLRVTGWLTLLFALLLFVLVEGKILSHCRDQGEPGLEYIVVLGAQVRGTTPSLSLQLRLEAAAEYLADNPDTKVIVSGGQGSGEDISEAEAMAEYLRAQGISEERILLEAQAATTEENLRFSQKLMADKAARIGIVTNDFHVFRSLQMAEKIGLNACGIAAPSVFYLQPNYLMREFFAVIKSVWSGTI